MTAVAWFLLSDQDTILEASGIDGSSPNPRVDQEDTSED